ncbi:MAG: histidine phosphatase family protein [Actinobacteria bacterium]|nr:histidine phosphatase family protein [Actinomycetota bacterium]
MILVRHALTPMTGKKLSGWLPGINLSDEGREQAKATAARLSDIKIDAAFTSPLERCVQTAEIILQGRDMSATILEDLGEIKYGQWEGRSLASLYKTKAWKQLKSRPADFRFPGGETIREAQVRGMRAIEAIRTKKQGKVVLVFSHADMIRILVAGYLGLALDLYDRISVWPATATVMQLGEGQARLLKLAEGDGLAEIVQRSKQARSKV